MTIKEVSSCSIHFTDHNPIAFAKAIKACAINTDDGRMSILHKAVADDIDRLLRNQLFPMSKKGEGRMLSLSFEGQSYMIKYAVGSDLMMINCHPGEMPGVEPLRLTAEYIDHLASMEDNTRE